MTTPPTGAVADLELLGSIARLLNSGSKPEETLAVVADRLRGSIPALSVSIWRREPNSTALQAITSPRQSRPGARASYTDLPQPLEDIFRLDLKHSGELLGSVDVNFGGHEPSAAIRNLLGIVGDMLAPYMASIELSEDLAYEVAMRSREIEEQRRFVSLVVDCLPVGLYVVERETGTQGLRRDEVMGRPIFEVLTRQPAAQLKAEFDEVFETGQTRQMEIEVTIAGEEKHFRITKIPMRQSPERITHVITIGEDVSQTHQVQVQVLQSEKLAAIGQLAAGVMHEINNPLATIGACVAALGLRFDDLPMEVPPAFREYLDIIEKEVQRCTGIVDGLLDFSRSKERTKRPVDIGALLEDTLFLLKHHQRFKRLTVVRDLVPGLPLVRANSEQMIQVFMAMMLNALDAMEDRGTMTVRTRPGAQRAGEVVVEIQDTGIGIPRSELSKIFEPFYTTKPPGRGTGLGLSVCYGIVEGHGGRIEVDSQPGRGSTFSVYLPTGTGSER
jgi:PAS domain S-box-containing protein